MATRMRIQSQARIISLGHLNETSQSRTLLAESSQCYLTEIIKPNDPRENYCMTIEAKYVEIRDLLNRSTFRAVLSTELPEGANLTKARYNLAVKSDKNKEERYKARYGTREHLHIMKDYLVHGVQTIQCVLARIILVVARISDFRIWVVDAKLAYQQFDKPLSRNIFITIPAPEFELSPEECL